MTSTHRTHMTTQLEINHKSLTAYTTHKWFFISVTPHVTESASKTAEYAIDIENVAFYAGNLPSYLPFKCMLIHVCVAAYFAFLGLLGLFRGSWLCPITSIGHQVFFAIRSNFTFSRIRDNRFSFIC